MGNETRVGKEAYLGKVFRDVVTGFTGTAVGYFSWMTGCDTAQLQPKVDKDGKDVAAGNFDINRLEEVNGEDVEVNTSEVKGGPHDCPTQNHI